MFPENRSDERNKNRSSPPQNEYNVFEEDDDLVEIMQSYDKAKEKEDVVEVRVLVVKPGNTQRLLTCDVPLQCDERDILLEPACEDSGILDDEVIEITQNEANHMSDNEIEEIRADDDVLIEKVILKHDLCDQEKDKSAVSVDASCEEMEVDQSQQIQEIVNGVEEDVIPIETYATLITEDNDVQEVPALPTEKFANYCEDDKEIEEIEEIRATMAKCDTENENESIIEEYFAQVNGGVKELVDNLNLTNVEEDEKKMEEDSPSFEEVTDSEKETEETVFEEVGDNESGKEKEDFKADSMEVEENESGKEIEEGEKAMEDDVETVCIVDDTLDDDENENSSQTSGDKTILFIYPMSRGGITMTRDDYECLSEYQYLNDIIIDFYLNYLMREVLSPMDRERTHLFSSHFYTRLTKQSADEDSACSSLDERRYAGVQRWTKDVDIFQKDFIIVPINEHSHWFLAIICFPKLVDFVGWGDFECETEGKESQKPCILIFDSLGVSKKTRVAVTLRGYLRHEYMAKTNEKKSFTHENLKTVYPKAPCQQNATDCGLYVLQYVESFFKDPLLDFTLPLKDLSDWFPPTVIERKREKIAKLIAKLAIKYNKNKTVHLPLLKLPKPKLVESQAKAIQSKKSETSLKNKSKHKANVQSKKKSPTKRIELSKRLKGLCDTDSDSDATVPISSTSKSKLRVSSYNPQPLRRSAYVPRSQMSRYYSFDSEDSSPAPTKSTSTVPSSFLKEDARSNCSSNRTAERTYLGPRDQPSWPNFSYLMGSKKEKEKRDALNTRETTKTILKSGGTSTDRFYNLSIDALYNAASISSNTSFSQYKIKRKDGNTEI